MATGTINNIKKGVVSPQGFLQHDSVPIDHSTFPFNQGDLIYWDSSVKLAKPVIDDSSAAALLGVALEPSQVKSNLDNTQPTPNTVVTAGYAAIASLKSTASETYNNGDLVYVGADAQTITTVTGSYAVGVVRLASHQSALTGADGVLVPVLIYTRAFSSFTEFGFIPEPLGAANDLYCDINNGSDTIGTGSVVNPFENVDKAIAVIAALGDASASNPYIIHINSGFYPITSPFPQYVGMVGQGIGISAVDGFSITYGGANDFSQFFANLEWFGTTTITRDVGQTVNNSTFGFYNCGDGDLSMTGSGDTFAGSPFIFDNLTIINQTGLEGDLAGGNLDIGAVSLRLFSSDLFFVTISDVGVDTTSTAGLIQNMVDSRINRANLHGLIQVNARSCTPNRIRFFDPSPVWNGSVESFPIGDSAVGFQFFGGSSIDQVQLGTLSTRIRNPVVPVDTPYTIDPAVNETILTFASVPGPFAVFLPDYSAVGFYAEGSTFTIIDSMNDAATNNITINTQGTNTFLGGGTTLVISTNGGSRTVRYSGGIYYVIASV